MKLKFITGVESVTGANFLLDTGNFKILIDCGLIQDSKAQANKNYEDLPYDPSKIDYLFVTHAHLDHVGRIPKLVKVGFRGKIISTKETKELARIVLDDAATLLEREAREDGKEPIFYLQDVEPAFQNWTTYNYHEDITLNPEISFFMKDAGHILGSTMFTFSVGPKKIMFTGDLGNSPSPLLRDTEEIGDIDYLVMESVYGDRNHESKEERVNQLLKVINNTVNKGGTLVIPAFSIERTQVLLYELNNLAESGKLPNISVFVDSPMATKVTDVYTGSTDLFNEKIQNQMRSGDDVFDFRRLKFTLTSQESRDIYNIQGPKIILAGSGMSVGGRVVSHEAKYLPDERNTILLVGYQSAGSIGRELSEGAKKVNIRDEKINVRADIETIYGFSAHKDSDHLVGFVNTATSRLKKIFVVMGEPRASIFLAQRIRDELRKDAVTPSVDDEFEI